MQSASAIREEEEEVSVVVVRSGLAAAGVIVAKSVVGCEVEDEIKDIMPSTCCIPKSWVH